jgi:hypothetical protein
MKEFFMEKQISLALIGAGNRGSGIFGKYALEMPHRVKFTAVVDWSCCYLQLEKNKPMPGR